MRRSKLTRSSTKPAKQISIPKKTPQNLPSKESSGGKQLGKNAQTNQRTVPRASHPISVPSNFSNSYSDSKASASKRITHKEILVSNELPSKEMGDTEIRARSKNSLIKCSSTNPIIELSPEEIHTIADKMDDELTNGWYYYSSERFLNLPEIGPLKTEKLQDRLFDKLSDLIIEFDGVSGLASQFQQKGLSHIINGWIDTGANPDISPKQIFQIFGLDKIKDIAEEFNLTEEQVARAITKFLPVIIDKLTPKGKVPNESELGKKLQNLEWKKVLTIDEEAWNKRTDDAIIVLNDIKNAVEEEIRHPSLQGTRYFLYRLDNGGIAGILAVENKRKPPNEFSERFLFVRYLVAHPGGKYIGDTLIEKAAELAHEYQKEGLYLYSLSKESQDFYHSKAFENDKSGHEILIFSKQPDVWQKGKNGAYQLLRELGPYSR